MPRRSGKKIKERIVLRYGAPEVFLSDNGTELKNQVMDKYLDEIGAHRSYTPPYYPQANPVERVNRTLKTGIMAFVEDKHSTWDEKLPELVFALNTASHSATGKSPAMLNYGREPVPPGSKRRVQDQAVEGEKALEDEAAWSQRMKNLSNLLDDAKHRSQEEQERHAEIYNTRRREPKFKRGDKVWKRNRVLSSVVLS